MRRVYLLVSALLLTVGLFSPHQAAAQDGPLCFDVPGITDCIEGRFHEYWAQNGGLQVFGYPISPATMQQTAEGTFLTQYFERNRFELHPEKARPYDVLLGRLGDDRLKQQGRDWFGFPKGQPTEGCLWFGETGHSVCDQEGGVGFRSYWEGHGLQDPALSRYARSLALFGLPLSEPALETNEAGDTVLTQWFDRVRFEWHPGKPREFKVLLGLLGNETVDPDEPPPPPPPPPPPSYPCATIGEPQDAILEPNCVRYGEDITFGIYGFEPNMEVAIWITQANGETYGATRTLRVNEAGFFVGSFSTSGWELVPGDYVFVAQDVQQRYRPSIAPFRVLP